MTATTIETKYQSSISYFGEPIYTYSLKERIEYGFLAPFKVVNSTAGEQQAIVDKNITR